MSTQPTWSWSLVSGSIGTISSTGLYTAPNSGTGTATVQATGGGLSATATITVTSGIAPAAPSNLVVSAVSSRKVTLSWTDNSNSETGFGIQRSTDGKTWSTIKKVGANVTSYSDTSVTRQKTYYYRVYAYNNFGNSAYSNVATVTTPNVLIAGTAGSTSAGTGPHENDLASFEWLAYLASQEHKADQSTAFNLVCG
jgi:hypothetical protein